MLWTQHGLSYAGGAQMGLYLGVHSAKISNGFSTPVTKSSTICLTPARFEKSVSVKKAGRLAGMMTPQGLQIASPEDSLARLGIITNGIVIVDIVFCVCIADCRRVPVRIQGRTDLFLLHGCSSCGFAFMFVYLLE
jgi:hypothetical protein